MAYNPYDRKANNSTLYEHPKESNLWEVHKAMQYDPYGQPALRIDDTSVQHTSRNRRKISTQTQFFFNTYQYTTDPQIWDEQITGTASAEFDQFQGGSVLSVGGTAGDEIVRQTRNVMQYIPGRQNEAMFALRFAMPEPGIRRRLGLFNENNGFYFEDNGGEYSVVLRRNTAEGPVETRITRDNWNLDRLDGFGPSKIIADASKMQMVSMEYEWFGAGIVEFKWIYKNNAFPIHRFDTSNIEDLPWSNTPFLPLRFELTNVDGAAGTHQMLQGSSTVASEGSVGPLGREENVTTPLSGVTTGSARVFRPVLSIRLRADRLQGVVFPLQFQTASIDNTPVYYRVVRDTTLTGADWNNVESTSFCEFDYSATAYTGGESIQTGYISSTNQGNVINFPQETILQLGRNDMGTTAQTFTLLAATSQSNKSVFASLSWVELR